MIEVNYPPLLASRISLQAERTSESLPPLFKNEIVEGKVLKSISPGQVLLLIKGRRVLARTHVPLGEGRILSLRVEETSPIPTFKLHGMKFTRADALNISTILSSIKENIWKTLFEKLGRSGPQQEAPQLFGKLMNGLSKELFSEASPGLLRELIDKSGLSWEAKLKKMLLTGEKFGGRLLANTLEGDLKGLASKALGEGEEAGTLLKRFVSTIENFQILNHLSLEQDKKIFLPIPMQFPDGLFTLGQLLIHLPQDGEEGPSKQKKGKDVCRITFLLELSNIGPLRADLAIQGKEIEGKFLVASEETKQMIEKSLPFFINRLRDLGFTVKYLECFLQEPRTVTESLLKEIVQEEGHSINLVA